MPPCSETRSKTRSRSPRRQVESEDARVDVQQRALNVVMLQLLAAQDEGDYQLYGVNARMFATDAAGTIALHNTCKQLASHDAKDWHDTILFCYYENREEARMADPEAFF